MCTALHPCYARAHATQSVRRLVIYARHDSHALRTNNHSAARKEAHGSLVVHNCIIAGRPSQIGQVRCFGKLDQLAVGLLRHSCADPTRPLSVGGRCTSSKAEAVELGMCLLWLGQYDVPWAGWVFYVPQLGAAGARVWPRRSHPGPGRPRLLAVPHRPRKGSMLTGQICCGEIGMGVFLCDLQAVKSGESLCCLLRRQQGRDHCCRFRSGSHQTWTLHSVTRSA